MSAQHTQKSACLSSCLFPRNCSPHNFFTSLLQSSHPVQVSRVRMAFSGVLFKGSLPQPSNPPLLTCRYPGPEVFSEKEREADCDQHKKNKAASFLDNHYWNCPVICTFSGSQRQTQSLATGRDATDKGGECVPACVCVWDA